MKQNTAAITATTVNQLKKNSIITATTITTYLGIAFYHFANLDASTRRV
jgi:hypothetical protein